MRLPRLLPLRPSSLLSRRSHGSFVRRCHAVSTAELRFGQPVHETHPHMLKPGELTPGINAQEYADRRSALALAMADGGVAVLRAAALQYKSGAVFHPYRQESNFLWLTGWNEDDAVAIIEKTGPAHGDYVFRMFVRPKDPRQEQWSGYRNGVVAAEDVFNADEARPVGSVVTELPRILESAAVVYTADARRGVVDDTGGVLRDCSARAAPLGPLVNGLRAIKSPAEVANMRRAGRVSGRAITEAMRRPWSRERDLHAFLDYRFVVDGCDRPAYVPVVAGSERANCIHYTANDAALRDDELILVDAGAEYGTYVTDISRTWPDSGRFTAAQRDLYEAVLRVQRAGVSLCRASAGVSLDDIHAATARALVDELRALGFDMSAATLDQLYPHHVGHYVGLDVHDCPGLSRAEPLRRGHCVTVEPGVYVPDDERWPRHFRRMGIRIEDSVCVDDSPLVLTTEAVKEVDDIEALRA